MKNMTSHVKMFLMFPHVFVWEVTKYLNAQSHVDNTLSVHILIDISYLALSILPSLTKQCPIPNRTDAVG